ncbi:MAG: HEPN domain-containing protein [Candidatus Moraniibacteriota bacterium]
MESIKILITYWHKLADEKWKTTEGLMNLGRYADALFFCHLVIEAELKARVVIETGENAPFIHDLPRLAQLAVIVLSNEQNDELEEISTFNIEGRYDDYKFAFYKKATKHFAEKHFKLAYNLRLWIRKYTPPEKSGKKSKITRAI